MNDTDVMRKILEQIRTVGSIDYTTLRLQFYSMCKGDAIKFTEYLAFLAETGAIKLNLDAHTVEKIS